jgi:hypothetical protein
MSPDALRLECCHAPSSCATDTGTSRFSTPLTLFVPHSSLTPLVAGNNVQSAGPGKGSLQLSNASLLVSPDTRIGRCGHDFFVTPQSVVTARSPVQGQFDLHNQNYRTLPCSFFDDNTQPIGNQPASPAGRWQDRLNELLRLNSEYQSLQMCFDL